MLQRAARNAYSWWWASHIRTKQSKWLDDNLQDMEEKVQYMLKIVENDGDSFRQRAEMYYKKRPELINLVEESFRCYRALAERYDHLSKELQSANRTIASIYPERVELHMDEEEEEEEEAQDFPSTDEVRKPRNNFPDAPKLDIPKPMVPIKNTGKESSRLVSKNESTTNNDVRDITPSGFSKSEALKEIDKLQKTILIFQTEKEFVKSSYEKGVAKYWEIENQVTEMQAEVCYLQDEFGISSFIEDDEARTLMTATALNSCQQTLARLQQKHKESTMAALFECQKVQQLKEKFMIFKEEFQRNNKNTQEEQQLPAPNLEIMNLEKQIGVEALRTKIKEELQVSSSDSLGATEVAEKVDELVDKVINMECEIASHNAYVKKLGSETNYLQEHLQSLQQENASLTENSDCYNNKIRDLEEELECFQSLKQCVADRSNNLQSHLTEASCNLDDLSEKLQNVKPDKDIGSIFNDFKSMEWFQDSLGPVMAFEADEVTEALQENRTISKAYVDDHHEHIKGRCDISSSSTDMMSSSRTCGKSEPKLPKQADDDQIDFQFGYVAKTGPMIQAEAHEDTMTSQLIKHENTYGMTEEHEGFNPFVDVDTMTKQDSINGMLKQPEGFNPFVDVYKEKDVVATAMGNYCNDTIKHQAEVRSGHAVDQGNIEEAKRLQKVYGDPYLEQAEFAMEGDEPNWKELFLNGIDDKEKILLKEYTSILRSYKEVKMKLNEVEKKKRAGSFQHAIQVKLLRSYNAVKDAEIQSLHNKLNSDVKENLLMFPKSLKKEPSNVSNMQSPDESNQSALKDIQEELIFEKGNVKEESNPSIQCKISYVEEGEGGDIKIINVEEAHTFSTIEEKIRMDIDELLEENIEFWLRFSTSFHQIQKFQNSIQDLKAELAKLRETKKDDLQDKKSSLQLSSVRPIYRHLREIQTELSLWLDHNAVLKDDLENRLSSLSSILEEITRLSSISSEIEEGELIIIISPYQAAKFQGEIMNMKQENNKIANELESGLSRVKNLQLQIQGTLNGLDEELGITKTHARKPRIPLRSFLFGVKLKKQRQSLFSCVTPSLQKQSSHIGT